MIPYHWTLYRHHERDGGTWGVWFGGANAWLPEHAWYTMELPWRHNANDVSCIPTGRVAYIMTPSPKFGRELYVAVGIMPRRGVRMHPANWPRELEGCQALGLDITEAGGIESSGTALEQFHGVMRGNPFVLDIVTELPRGCPPIHLRRLDRLCAEHGGVRLGSEADNG